MQAAVRKHIAYDLSRFDNRSIVREQVKKTHTKKAVKTNKRRVVSGFAVFCYIMCMGLMVTTLYSYVALPEASGINISLKKELAELQEENQLLEIQKTQKISSEKIREHAEKNLGMKKISKSQITYVCTDYGDKTEIIRDDGFFNSDSRLIAGIANGFSRFVEYIN